MKLRITLAIIAIIILLLVKFGGSKSSSSITRSNKQEKENIGILISTIKFKLITLEEEKEVFEDGFVPWISIAEPEKEIDRLLEADNEVLPYNKATLIISYPLNNPATFELQSTGTGFSRKQLIIEISKRYHQIFNEEDRSAVAKTIAKGEGKEMVSKNETTGKYGIWGHDISDLDLSSIEVYKTITGKIVLRLGVES